MKLRLNLICALAIFLSAFLRAETIETPATPVPEWAVGVISFKQIGPSFDKVQTFADAVVPGSGDLAKNISKNFLFKFPIDQSVKRDAPAFIYLLETKLDTQTAAILNISDAAAFKTAVTNTFGPPAEADGVMTFTIPQPLPLPDKPMLVKISGEYAVIAPNAKWLNDAEGLLAQKETMLKAPPSDAALTISVPALKKAFGPLLELLAQMGLGQATAGDPAAQERVGAWMKSIIDALWQLESIELHAGFDAKNNAVAELKVVAKGDGTVAAWLAKSRPSVSGQLPGFDGNVPFWLAWQINGATAAQFLRDLANAEVPKLFKNQSDLEKKNLATLIAAVTDLVESTAGETMLGVRSAKVGRFGIQAATQYPAPEKFHERVRKVLGLFVDIGTIPQPGQPQPLKIFEFRERPASGGVNILELTFKDVIPDFHAAIEPLSNWLKFVSDAVVGKNAVAVIGPEAPDTVKQIAAGKAEGYGTNAPLVPGANIAAQLRALEVLKLLAPLTFDGALTAGLPDEATGFSLRTVNNTGALQIVVSPKTVIAVRALMDRAKRQHIDILNAIREEVLP